MPRTKEANQLLRENQRAKILQAARKVFARKGMSATIADIAAEAGISQGLAYRYFASKEEILKELVTKTTQSSPLLVQRILEDVDSPWKRLELLLTRIFENQGDRLEYYRFSVNAMNDDSAPNELRKALQGQGLALQVTMRQLIVDGQAAGEVAVGDPDQMVMAIMACLDGLSSLALRTPERYKNHYPDVSIILRMLKP